MKRISSTLTSAAALITTLSHAQDENGLTNTVDTIPGVFVEGRKAVIDPETGEEGIDNSFKFGVLTMKTAWKNTGSAENASIDVGLYIKVVGNEGVDNFHKGCAWQIGISKDSTVQEAEVQ